MNYETAIKKINSFLRFGMKPGLERVGRLLKLLGSPQDKLKFIHVAGTNGKGSTCKYISTVLTKAGYKTGLFISPFVIDFRERFQIDNKMIEKEELCDLLSKVLPFVEEMKKEGMEITEFELITAMAFKWFSDMGCDFVVLEVGLGGRVDSTNVIKEALVSVISSISYDHTTVLGNTIKDIATEKAGIIKENATVVVSIQRYKDAVIKIREVAKEKSARLIEVNSDDIKIESESIEGSVFYYNGSKYSISLPGRHQVENAVTAITVFDILCTKGFYIEKKAIIAGLKESNFPARFELLCKDPIIILDGAHNRDGARVLGETIDRYIKKDIIALIGILKDKEVCEYIKCLVPKFSSVVTVDVQNSRSLSKEELATIVSEYCPDVTVGQDTKESLIAAINRAKEENKAVLVSGSLYLASEVRKYILDIIKK